jgi:hypothetical protein
MIARPLQGLVRTMIVIMSPVASEHLTQMPLTIDQQMVQVLAP